MIDLGAFPGILDSGRSVIYGEVYEVDNSVLEMCDLIEGHPNFYSRKFIKLEFDINAEAYFLPQSKYKIILKLNQDYGNDFYEHKFPCKMVLNECNYFSKS